MILLKDKEINIEQWQHLVENSDTASFFQTKTCYDFYCSLSFMQAFAYAVEERGKLQALVCGYIVADGNKMKQYFSRRAIILGGAILSNNISIEALELLLVRLKTDLLAKAIYIEFRNFHDYSAYKAVFEKVGFEFHPHLNFQIDLTTKEEVFAKLSDSKKRQVKQSLNTGVSYELTLNHEDIVGFYQILKTLYQYTIKLPLFPIEFFETIVNHPFSHLLVIKSKNKVIGGILAVGDGNVMYEWFVCGSAQNEPNIYPSVLATWAGIQQGLDTACSRFDFMGAGKPDKEYGVREFKSKFGGELVEHGRFLYICKPLLYKIGKSAIQMRKIF